MEIKIKQKQKPTYNRNLVTEEYITAQLADAVDKRLSLGALPANEGFVSLWFRANKGESIINTKGSLMFDARECAEADFELNKSILGTASNALYIYAVGAYFIIKGAEKQHTVRTVLLHAEGLETF